MSPSALFVTTVPITLEVFLTPFARHFRAQGWRVDGMANGAASETAIHDAFDSCFDIGWMRNPLAPSNFIGTSTRVREVVAADGYDIVHVHTPIAAFMTRFALRKRRAGARPAVIYTAHGFHFYRGQNPLPHALYRTMERIAAPWTDYLVTINAEDHDAALGLGIAPDKVRLVPGIGVDVDAYTEPADAATRRTAIRDELGIAPDAFMLLMVAEFAPVKRHTHVLEALAATTGDVVLVLVGTGPLEADVRQRVADLGLSDRVRFTGYRRDVPDLLIAADALTLVSEREGLPRSVLEAMAASRPVIGTDTRGIADAIGDEAGWVVPKNDIAALARAIDEAAAHPDATLARGRAARVRAETRFSLSSIIAAYEELYREALASRV